ncbi:hypothetical protein HMPREF1544_12142 [Mucor circinelloides 1006PhL]|uniref:Uncharacterized protein n=1 Tax=Mucor circinelloides f. circinelloides (strain 1006PhL) TaxID=1220926 RepID=S2IU20_MUCC1|nr:hypothetical protein HMPREF1544_12142 [Mucor circinelloides 1006PhL]
MYSTLRIKGAARTLNKAKRNQKRVKTPTLFGRDTSVHQRQPYQRFNICRLDNEPVTTYNQLKYKFLKKLFPGVSSAITFSKKYLEHHH